MFENFVQLVKFLPRIIYNLNNVMCIRKNIFNGYHHVVNNRPFVTITSNNVIVSSSSTATNIGGKNHRKLNILGFSLAFLGFFEKKVPIEEEIVMYIKKAILATQRQEYNVADENLGLAFYYSKEHGLSKAMSQVVSLQANLAFNRGKFDEAEKLYKFLTQRLINLEQATVTDNSFVEISIKLAEIYGKTGRIDEAISGFIFSVSTQKKKINDGAEDEDTLLLCAWALQSLGQVYLRLLNPGNKSDPHLVVAIKCLNEAFTYVSKAIGPESEQAIGVQTDLATAYALQGNINEALKINQGLQKLVKEEDAELVPQINLNIAQLYLQKSEYEEANKLCIEVRDLGTKFKNMELVQRAEECITNSLKGKEKLKAKA